MPSAIKPKRSVSSRALMVLGVLLAMGGVVVQLTGGHASWAVLLGALALVMSQVLPPLQAGFSQRDDFRRLLIRTTTTAGRNGRLRKVGELRLSEFGVHPAVVQVNYLPRDLEVEAERVFASGRPILLIGPAMSGKSRTAAEMIRTHFRRRPILIPIPEHVEELMQSGAPKGTVILLDSLDRYLNEGKIRPEWIRMLVKDDNIVVSTIRESDYRDAIEGSSRSWRVALSILDEFRVLRLPDDDVDELTRMAWEMPDSGDVEVVQEYGIGAFVAGGTFAIATLLGSDDTNRLGAAMVRSASYWSQLGYSCITEARLVQLAKLDIAERHRVGPCESVEDAIAWATKPIQTVIQMLEPGPEHTYRSSRFLVEFLARTNGVPDHIWRAALDSAKDPKELYDLGYAAYGEGTHGRAVSALVRASESPSVREAATAVLGLIEEDREHDDHARQFYMESLGLDSDRDGRIGIAIDLGKLEARHGRVAAARHAFDLAATSGDPYHAPGALMEKALLEQRLGNSADAQAAFSLAVAWRHPEYSGFAAIQAAGYAAKNGHAAQARNAYMEASTYAAPRWRKQCLSNWADLNVETSSASATMAELLRLSESKDQQVASAGGLALGGFRWSSSDFLGARKAYGKVLALACFPYDLMAVADLGCHELKSGSDVLSLEALEIGVEIMSAYRHRPIPRGQSNRTPDWLGSYLTAVSHIWFHIGETAERESDIDSARDAYEEALTMYGAYTAAAALNLARLELQGGRVKEAVAAYEIAISEAHEDHSPRAALEVSDVFRTQGDGTRLKAALVAAVAMDHPDYSPQAAYELDRIEVGAQGNAGKAEA